MISSQSIKSLLQLKQSSLMKNVESAKPLSLFISTVINVKCFMNKTHLAPSPQSLTLDGGVLSAQLCLT